MEGARAPLQHGRVRQILCAGVLRLGRSGYLQVLMSIRIAVLGAGNMGGALIGGIVNRLTPAGHVIASTRTPERAAELSAKYGIQATAGCNREAAAQSDLTVLAVKPGTLPKVVTEIRPALTTQKILLSLAASVPIALIEKLAGLPLPIFRAMPNIPV